jgi:hypothetical protein
MLAKEEQDVMYHNCEIVLSAIVSREPDTPTISKESDETPTWNENGKWRPERREAEAEEKEGKGERIRRVCRPSLRTVQ